MFSLLMQLYEIECVFNIRPVGKNAHFNIEHLVRSVSDLFISPLQIGSFRTCVTIPLVHI